MMHKCQDRKLGEDKRGRERGRHGRKTRREGSRRRRERGRKNTGGEEREVSP